MGKWKYTGPVLIPYDPQKYHSNVVRNLRQLWKEEIKDTELVLSDPQIWEVFQTWASTEASDDEFPDMRNRYDACVLSALVDKNHQEGEGKHG